MATYSPSAPTIEGTEYTCDYLMNNPVLVNRVVRSITELRMIGGIILKGRVDMTGSGVAIVEDEQPIMVDDSPEPVGELSEVKLIDDNEGTASVVKAASNAFGTRISDEAISRNRFDVVTKKLTKMANRAIVDFDGMVMSAVGSAVTKTSQAAQPWNVAGADQFLDLLLASAVIDELDQGYAPNVVIARPTKWARLVSSLAHAFPQIATPELITKGNIVEVAGLTLLKTNRLPSETEVMALDNNVFGAVGFERVPGDYIGDPGDVLGVETYQFRPQGIQGWQVQMRKNGVPMIQEPSAAIKVVGV